jgi:hypothetical protein
MNKIAAQGSYTLHLEGVPINKREKPTFAEVVAQSDGTKEIAKRTIRLHSLPDLLCRAYGYVDPQVTTEIVTRLEVGIPVEFPACLSQLEQLGFSATSFRSLTAARS